MKVHFHFWTIITWRSTSTRSPPSSSAVFSWRATRFLQMTQVCRNLWLRELIIFVFMYLYSSGLQKFWSAGQQLMRIFFLLNFWDFFGFMDYKNWWLWKPKNQQTLQFCCRKAKNSCFGPKTLIYSIFVANLHICVSRIKFRENLLMSTSRRLCNHDIHNCVFVIDLMKRLYMDY